MVTKEAVNWLPVSDLEVGFNENKLPATSELAGKEIKLSFESNPEMTCSFKDARSLVLTEGSSEPTAEKYEAMLIAPGIYFVDLVKKKPSRESITLAINFNTGKGVVVKSIVPTRREANRSFISRMNQGLDLSPMKISILQADINKSAETKKHSSIERTEDLVGKRIQYTYSRQHTYEHFYLNHRFYAWQCLKGPEKGTADADISDYFKVAPNVYLFIWREKVIPTVGIVLINLKDLRSNGKIFGLDIPSGKAVNFTMGAFAKIIEGK